MHTYADGEWRFLHNGGFDGDIIIAKFLDEGDQPCWWHVWEHRTTSEAVLELVTNQHVIKTVVLHGLETTDPDGHTEPFSMKVPFEVLNGFVADRYVRRTLENWVDQLDTDQMLILLPVVAALRTDDGNMKTGLGAVRALRDAFKNK